jgi:hypothetical protein
VAILPRSSIVLNSVRARPLVEPQIDRQVGLLGAHGPEQSWAAQAFIMRASGHDWGVDEQRE